MWDEVSGWLGGCYSSLCNSAKNRTLLVKVCVFSRNCVKMLRYVLFINPLSPSVAIRVQLKKILCETDLSRHLYFWHPGTLTLNPLRHRMLYSCTRMATVVVIWLNLFRLGGERIASYWVTLTEYWLEQQDCLQYLTVLVLSVISLLYPSFVAIFIPLLLRYISCCWIQPHVSNVPLLMMYYVADCNSDISFELWFVIFQVCVIYCVA